MQISPTNASTGLEIPQPQWMAYLDTLDWGSGNRDASGHKAALRAASLRIDPQAAADEIAHRITAAGMITPGKLENQIRRAYEYAAQKAVGPVSVIKYPAGQYDPAKLAEIAAKAPLVDQDWLKKQSPVNPVGLSPVQILHRLYQPGEKVLIFEDWRSQGDYIVPVGEKLQPPIQISGKQGAWFLVNPVDGKYHPNPRQGGDESRRSEESITHWRYQVLESDKAPLDQWLRALVQLPLKISAIYTSGGKSIHALVRLDASSKPDWDLQRDQMRAVLVMLGADAAAMTAVRLSRLPGIMRGPKLQELLYLNPNPTDTPIFTPHE